MTIWLGDNPIEHTDEPMGEPDVMPCALRISRPCTKHNPQDGDYLWQGEPCCVFCLTLAEESWERAQARMSAAMELEARR